MTMFWQRKSARVPLDVPDVLRYCIEVMTIVILRLGKGAGRQSWLNTCLRLSSGRARLPALV